MTVNRNLKRQVRARAAKTGESYTAALRHVRPAPAAPARPEAAGLRLAVAQTTLRGDPRDPAALRGSGREIRRLVRDGHRAGARLLHFPEGATCAPRKKVMSVAGPDEAGPADWDRFRWDVLEQELAATAQLAAGLRLWTVLGSVHRLTPPHRPHNSLYVISDRGEVVSRYDERMLSSTKISYLYSPGAAPVTFEAGGLSFGCALGLEATFPEVFGEYERLGVDCVLLSTHGPGTPVNSGPLAWQARAHAAGNGYWVSYAGSAQDAVNAPSGVIGPDGEWRARCRPDAVPALAVADLAAPGEGYARRWRRAARGGRYDGHLVRGDPRSSNRAGF
jgi:predicted amidohydrolase